MFDALGIRVDYLLGVGAGLTVDRLESNQRHSVADHIAEDFGVRIFSIPSVEKIFCDLLLNKIGFYKIWISLIKVLITIIIKGDNLSFQGNNLFPLKRIIAIVDLQIFNL